MYVRSFARLSVLSRFVDARDDLNFKDHHVCIMLPIVLTRVGMQIEPRPRIVLSNEMGRNEPTFHFFIHEQGQKNHTGIQEY